MKDNLYTLIENSNLTLIGYTYKNERLKDAFISKFNPLVINEIDESFSMQSYLRDFRINSILSNGCPNVKYLLIDLTDIRFSKEGMMDRPKIFRKIAEDLRVYSTLTGIRSILTSAMYRTISDGMDKASFSGGMGPVYTSDLVMSFGDDFLSIVKSRTHLDNFKISYDELKENSYI